MSHPPTVSVLITCYNLGRFLDEAVTSVLDQTCQDTEIIVVDDGSDDKETVELLAGYDRPRTTVLRTNNRGLAAARNHAIAHSQGRFLSALDADDRLHPEFLAKTVAVLDAEPDVAFVSCWLQTFDAEEWIWKQHDCGFPKLLAECTVATPALVRREAVTAVGGYDEEMSRGHEDWDLWISLVEQGYSGRILPEVLFYYRRRPDSMTSQSQGWDQHHLEMYQNLLRKHRETYRKHLFDVLRIKDTEIGALLLENYETERQIHSELVPRVEHRRREVQRLEQRLEQTRAAQEELRDYRRQLAQLEAEYLGARQWINNLLASKSWRITAPLRAVYDLWLRLRGPAND